jgi:hypothetical protein
MRFKPFLAPILAVLFTAAAAPAFSQVVPEAGRDTTTFAIGAGASNFDVDWGKSRMYGATLWADWHPGILPSLLNGLSVEIEARDLNYLRSPDLPTNFRQDTAGGGAIYSWNRFRNFHPYGKGSIQFGSFDFRVGVPGYTHDTRTLYAMGGGFDYRVLRRIWVRADYEYQVWQPMFGPIYRPDPQGFSLGAMYHLGAQR